MLELKNKKILIIGASGNIGSNLVLNLSKLGAKLIIAGRNEKRLNELLTSLKGANHEAKFLDVLDFAKISDFMKALVNDGVKLDGLVYVTGLMPNIPIRTQNIENLDLTMKTNFYGFFEAAKHFSKKSISNEGSSIVAFSSYAALNPGKSQLAYGASKAAIDNAIKVMAKEFSRRNIRANSIRPAMVENFDNQENFDESTVLAKEFNELIISQNGLIECDQISNLVAFLLSDNSKFINGENLDIKGLLC